MRVSTYSTASALAALAAAQTFSDCNPMEKACPNNPAMPKTWETDFTAGKDAVKGWKQTAGSLTYGAEGAEFTVERKGDAPTIGSEGYFHFGYVEVVMKAAPGVGIISSIVLQSDDLDEVDWEWIGGVDSLVQANYFGKGNTTTYDRMVELNAANNQNEFHKYALNWTSESITWIIDDAPLRTLNFADANGGKTYPQTPCNVRLGNWPGGDSENEGTRQWAGGNVTYSKGPFTMVVKSIKVVNYSPGTEYKWTDKSGDFGSIEVIDAGNAEGAPQNTVVIEPSATATLAPLESGVDAPSATGEGSDAVVSTTCTESKQATTPAPSGAAQNNGTSGFNFPTGSAVIPQKSASPDTPSDSDSDSEETPCECGTATVTVTGAPPPAIFTTEFPAIPFSSLTTLISSAADTPPVSSVVITSAVASALYPTSGLEIDTASSPVISFSAAPTGALPQVSGNATVSAPLAQFTGAGNRVGLSGGLAVVVVMAMLVV